MINDFPKIFALKAGDKIRHEIRNDIIYGLELSTELNEKMSATTVKTIDEKCYLQIVVKNVIENSVHGILTVTSKNQEPVEIEITIEANK